jgi:hypothetical protein
MHRFDRGNEGGKLFKLAFEIVDRELNMVVAFATAASCLGCDDDHALNGRRSRS